MHGRKISLIADTKISGIENAPPECANGRIMGSKNFQIRYYWGVMFFKENVLIKKEVLMI